MKSWKILFFVFFYFYSGAYGLKCRTATETQQKNDFEYVVRMCLRHLKNESDIYDFYRMRDNYESDRNKRHRDEMSNENNNNNNNNNENNNNNNNNRNYFNRNRGNPEGFDRFWPSNGNSHDRNRYNDEERNGGDYDDWDFFGGSRKDGRKKYKGRPQMPHSYQQQLQHDRDVMYGRGNRDSSYFYANKNKNTKLFFNKEKHGDSPLAEIDPCVIHCIFQEMQMVDENGKPNKGLISQRMTQKIRNSELKNFIQESVEECYQAIGDDDFGNNYNNNNNRYGKNESMCEWAKSFAMCLEDKGKDNCDDWNDPVQKNNNNSNSNNEEQRHKTKQNDRG